MLQVCLNRSDENKTRQRSVVENPESRGEKVCCWADLQGTGKEQIGKISHHVINPDI